MQKSPDTARSLLIRHIENNLGLIGFIENQDIPFSIQRVYFLSNIPKNTVRGCHGHKKLQQFLIALSGSFDVRVVSKTEDKVHTLSTSTQGLYIPANCWRELSNFTRDSICLVLASDIYDESDYFYDLAGFIKSLSKE